MDRVDNPGTWIPTEGGHRPGCLTHDLRAEAEFEQFARLAVTICRRPIAAVTPMAAGMQWIKGAWLDAASCFGRVAINVSATEIGEGVETPPQAAQLLLLGCSIGQAFLYGRALPAAAIRHALPPKSSVSGRGHRRPMADRLFLPRQAA